jgi:hypothetical protein
MEKLGGLCLDKAVIFKLIILFIIAGFIISCVFRFLIKSNKIKPSKISRLFYMDDEGFVKYWDKKRSKGKIKFVLYDDVIISIVIWVTSLSVIVLTDGDLNKLEKTLPVFWGYLIGTTIGSLLRWNKNEKKSIKLTKNIE